MTDPSGEVAALTTEVDRLKTQVAVLEYQRGTYEALLKAGNPALAALNASGPLTYMSDGLATWNKSVSFLLDERFVAAYRRGMASGHHLGGTADGVPDIGVHWRIAISCWAARHAARLPGDFVECGTNTGITSLAVCDYLDFGRLDKTFWLFDTFRGVPAEQLNDAERAKTRDLELNAIYPECFELATRNFAPFANVKLVRGKVPDTLASVDIDRVCYLAIDMNIEAPERAALAHFWPKLVPGGIVVFDDYGWLDHRGQKDSHDAFARSQGVEIFALPTGQGLLLKS